MRQTYLATAKRMSPMEASFAPSGPRKPIPTALALLLVETNATTPMKWQPLLPKCWLPRFFSTVSSPPLAPVL
eukprot:CCRYP_014880-RL/>CCRYP_014880-RL protein AED:0.47 eAED:0.47 QI:0/-1/0/1/-1/0/1/0/72